MPRGDSERSWVMTMMNGLETGDLDIMDEEFFGPPPRFLVEGNGVGYDVDGPADKTESLSLLPAISKIRKFVGAW
jgi:hypothetical protein